MKKKLDRTTKARPTKKAKAPKTRKKKRVKTSDGKGVTISEKGKGSASHRPLLTQDRISYNQMMAELARNGEPASVDVEPKQDPCPDRGRRRPAPTSDKYASANGDKKNVEGTRSVHLGAPTGSTPEDVLESREAQQELEELRANPPPELQAEIERKAEIVKIEVESAQDEASERSDSDEHPAVLMAGSTMRNPTGHKRSTNLDPDAHRSPEEILSEKEQKALDGEDQE